MSELGMYRVDEEDYPKVTIGDLTICRQDEKSVWIQREDGDGFQFSDQHFFKFLDEYYKKYF